MWESMQNTFNDLFSSINNTPFSWNSIEGIVVIILGLCCVHAIWNRATKAVIWAGGMIFMCQLLYVLSLTGLNDVIPLSSVFKYDVFASIAQCFAGTKVCDALLWFDSFLTVTFKATWDTVAYYIPILKPTFDGFVNPVIDMASSPSV